MLKIQTKFTNHLIVGSGDPFALHFILTFAPSLTTISKFKKKNIIMSDKSEIFKNVLPVDVCWSSIFGGTFRKWGKHLILFFLVKYNGELTNNLKITELSFRCHSINLTHIASLILFLHICDMQKPSFVLIVLVMCHRYSWISSNYMIMHSEYCWLFEMHPSYLIFEKEKDIGS